MNQKKKRVLILVLDSVGIGEMPDAHKFNDQGANTLIHTAQAVGGLKLPNFEKLGLGNLADIPGVKKCSEPIAHFGTMSEKSPAKDTTTGHWELAGLQSPAPFPTFPNGFPDEIISEFKKQTGYDILGNKPASGTVIIEELGEEHIKTGKLIVYTSADSVFQIAAHEEVVPVDELYRVCKIARKILDKYRVARVIARPFIGKPGSFKRTYNRKDFSIEPHGPTLLSLLVSHNIPVHGVGKIYDIFAGKGISNNIHTEGNTDGLNKTCELLKKKVDGLIFVNLVDFDMLYGHRRNPDGYARALEEVDRYLTELLGLLDDESAMIITADHGCDPTLKRHTDHTREYVPLIYYDPKNTKGRYLGVRQTFSDVAATVADLFGITWVGPGTSFAV